jgi:hypothetical protein
MGREREMGRTAAGQNSAKYRVIVQLLLLWQQ